MNAGATDDPQKPDPAATDSPAAGADFRPPITIPDHALLRKIGGGSYGDVWLARHQMGMYRAVKIVSRKSFERREPFERELAGIRRFEPVSRSHEGFVDVLHVGINQDEGWFYYVMELGDDEVAGQTIHPACYAPKTLARDIARRKHLPFRECLDLGLALTRALAELHRQNLVHRDIKPSNIIFVNGVPKLADIGLVADADDARSFVGTQGFIPPEGPGAPPADIYSLGKVLYECSTGQDRQLFPELPASLHEMPEADRLVELNAVILKACQPGVAERYQAAADMHSDLVVLERGESVQRLRTLERRWAKLKRAAAVFGLGAGILGALGFQGYREWRRTMESRQQQVGAHVALGTRAAESPDRISALTHFAGAAQLDRGNHEREIMHRLRFGSALDQGPKLERAWYFNLDLNEARLSPNGREILATEYQGKARLADLAGGPRGGLVLGQAQMLYRSAFNSDGTLVVTASADHTARVWSATNGAAILTLPHPDNVYAANFNPDNSRIVTGCRDGKVRIWDARNARVIHVIDGHTNAVLFATFSPDGRLVASASRDNTARIWDATRGVPAGPPLVHPSWVSYAAFDPFSRTLATGCYDHKARVWDVAAGRRLLADLHHQDGVSSVQYSPDGRYILTASLAGSVQVWDLENLARESNLTLRHSAKVTSACFAPDGHRVLIAAVDGSVRLWDLAGIMTPPAFASSASRNGTRCLVATNGGFQVFDMSTGTLVSTIKSAGETNETAELNGNGRFVLSWRPASSGPAGVPFQVWEAASGRPVGSEITVASPPAGFRLSQDGDRLATFSGQTAQLWDVATGKPLTSLLTQEEPVRAVFFSPNGRLLATIGGATARIWNVATGQPAFAPLVHSGQVSYVDFTADGSLLVTAATDDQFRPCSAQVWNAATGKAVGKPLEHADGVLRADFSPDGRRVVTASEDFTAVVWDAATGRQISPPLRHAHHVLAGAFSSDGNWVVTTSLDQSARVWNVETGEPLTPPLRHAGVPREAAFLPGDRKFVTFENSRQAWLWDLPIDRRPIEDLILLERLLSGDKRSTRQDWERLRAKYPADFVTSTGEVAAWHESEAVADETYGRWHGAAFHWEQLSAIRKGDTSVSNRLASARARLSETRESAP